MSRFRRDDAPSLVRAARQDASLTQAELAGMTGMSQSTLAQIESGRRAVSSELLERILRAADYRPSVPLARYASSISSYAQERGLGTLRVFGSIARGTDGFDSDIDLIGTPTRDLSLFELADIASFASDLTGFPTEVHADTHVPEALRAAIDEAVALRVSLFPSPLGRERHADTRPVSTPITSCVNSTSSPIASNGLPLSPLRPSAPTARSTTPLAW